jgi:hypothetical protein
MIVRIVSPNYETIACLIAQPIGHVQIGGLSEKETLSAVRGGI